MDQRQRPSWESVWMDLAVSISRRSKCSKGNYGCVLTSDDSSYVVVGYNSPPKGFETGSGLCDTFCPRMLEGGTSADYSNCCSVHAESNCVARADFSRIQGGAAYVSGVCCLTCARLIANCGVSNIWMLDDSTPYRPAEPVIELLESCGLVVHIVDKIDFVASRV